MTWNYRLIDIGTKQHPYYAIHEVYYDKKGKIEGWTENPIDIGSEDPKEIKDIMTTMLIDVHKAPILRIKKVKGEETLVEIKLKK